MIPLDFDFWSGKNVLITGHSGFKGRWITMMLCELGANVSGLALGLSPVPLPRVAEYVLDIRDTEALIKFIRDREPEVVIHLAAVSTVQDGLVDPLKTYGTNVLGTAGLLHAIKETESVRAAVIITSDKCYKNREWLWGYRENDELGANDPYSTSKAACELIVESFQQTSIPEINCNGHRLAVATARCGNVIGGGDLIENRLIPSLAKNAHLGTVLKLRNPQAIRPWLYVLDALRGYLLLANRLYIDGSKFSGAWNFGSAVESIRCVEEMAKAFYLNWDGGGSYEICDQETSVESKQLLLDSSRSSRLLKWQPIYSFDSLMSDTSSFYKRNLNGEYMTKLYSEYINKYFDECRRYL